MATNDPTWSDSVSPPAYPPVESSFPDQGTESSSTTQAAKQEASAVAGSASGAARHVATTTKDQAASVASDAKQQVTRLTDETRHQVRQQASSQKDRAVSTLRSLSQELQTMADRSEQSGPATKFAQQGSSAVNQLADFLERREPGDLVEELRNLARRRPGGFLAGAALAGVVAGRLTRGAVSSRSKDDDLQYGGTTTPTYTSYDYPVQPSPGYAEPSAGYTAGYAESSVPGSYGVADPLGAPTEVQPAADSTWTDPTAPRRDPGAGPVSTP
jgi:hypothetical protein